MKTFFYWTLTAATGAGALLSFTSPEYFDFVHALEFMPADFDFRVIQVSLTGLAGLLTVLGIVFNKMNTEKLNQKLEQLKQKFKRRQG